MVIAGQQLPHRQEVGSLDQMLPSHLEDSSEVEVVLLQLSQLLEAQVPVDSDLQVALDLLVALEQVSLLDLVLHHQVLDKIQVEDSDRILVQQEEVSLVQTTMQHLQVVLLFSEIIMRVVEVVYLVVVSLEVQLQLLQLLKLDNNQ